ALYRELTEDNPKAPGLRAGEAHAQRLFSHVVYRLGRPAEARDLCERAVEVFEALMREDPKMLGYRHDLAASLFDRGRARRALGDAAGATADAWQALGLFKGLESLSQWGWYMRAACHAALAGLAGAGMSAGPATAEAHADAAMALLHQAVAKGFRNAAIVRT